ncbi:MAG: hypothetical protein ACOYN0_09250 [Phycisphaerales bacterium]
MRLEFTKLGGEYFATVWLEFGLATRVESGGLQKVGDAPNPGIWAGCRWRVDPA